jgi:hypothetical protein
VLSTTMTGIAAPMMMHGKMMHGKTMHGKMMSSAKTVYVCKKCSMYYTPAQAKAMKYVDPMGHKLMKMSKVPAGYTMGSKIMMHKKMMMHGTMMHHKTM